MSASISSRATSSISGRTATHSPATSFPFSPAAHWHCAWHTTS